MGGLVKGGGGVSGAVDSTLGALKITDVTSDAKDQIYETLATITNGADGTYYYYVDMTGYRRGSFQLILNGGSGTVTVTVEGTIQADGTAAASCAYQDETLNLYGAATYIASAILFDTSGILGSFKYVRVKVLAATGGVNDADWTIYHKRSAA